MYIHKKCICKIQINIQPLIHVRFLCHRHLYFRSMPFFQILKSVSFFKFSNRHPILKSRAVSHFFNLTSNLRIPVIMNSVDADMSLKADLSLTYRNKVLDFVFIVIPLENIFPWDLLIVFTIILNHNISCFFIISLILRIVI
jgi:hypothetical protein